MNDFIYKTWFYLQNAVCWGLEKKTWNEKIPRLVALPSPLLQYGGRLFSCVRECRKQAGPTLSGKSIWSNGKKDKAGSGSVRTAGWIYSDEVPRSSEEVGWSKGEGIKIAMGKILEANNLVKDMMMTHSTLLTRYSRENKVYLLGIGSQRTRTANTMRRNKSNFMHIAPWSNGASAFPVRILTFPSISIVYSVFFLRFYLFMRYSTRPLQTDVIYDTAESCH